MPAQKNDRPKIEFVLEPDGDLRLSWGPSTGPWGIFSEGAKPVEVEVNTWWLYVGEMVNPLKPEQGSKAVSKDYNGRNMGTSTQITIPKALLPQKKTVVVQVLGQFQSKDVNEEPFEEGIFSDEVRINA